MSKQLTPPEVVAAAFALQVQHELGDHFLNRNIDDGLRDAAKCLFRHAVAEYVGADLLRPDARDRLDVDVQSGDNPTDLDMHVLLDGDHDPDAIKKMADWSYPTAEQVAADKKTRATAFTAALKAQQAKDEERRQLRLTMGKAMADAVCSALNDSLGRRDLAAIFGKSDEARDVFNDMMDELRSGGPDGED
jgi:hypothetical protein